MPAPSLNNVRVIALDFRPSDGFVTMTGLSPTPIVLVKTILSSLAELKVVVSGAIPSTVTVLPDSKFSPCTNMVAEVSWGAVGCRRLWIIGKTGLLMIDVLGIYDFGSSARKVGEVKLSGFVCQGLQLRGWLIHLSGNQA